MITGGDAEYLRQFLVGEYHVQADLLMQGLRYIAEQESCIRC